MPDPAAEPAPATPSGSVATPTPSPTVTPPADPATPPANPAAPPAPAPAEPAKPVEPPKVAAPEKYDFAAIKLPDGVKLDEPLLKAVEPVLRELGLSQEQANKLVDAQVKHLAAAEAQRETDFQKFMKDQVTQHQATLRSEWGMAHDANLQVAQRGMARVLSADAKKILDETGLGNHPEFVKAFFAVGKMVSEDTPPNSNGGGTSKSLDERFYPNMARPS